MSSAALREEILPLLSSLLKDSPTLGDSQDFLLSMKFGFTSEEHASLAGLPLSRRATKKLMQEYDEAYEQSLLERTFEPLSEEVPREADVPVPEKETEDKKDDEPDSPPGQMKLF